jgi:tetratricopeptide (TPR) repeat protein
MNSLGLTYETQTNWSEAESMLREVLALWRQRSGNDDLQTGYAMRSLAGGVEGQGKWAEAETVHREALVSWRKRSDTNNPHTLWEFENLARVLMRQKKFRETEQLLGEALTPAIVSQPSSCNLLAQRVELMGRQGRWQEAAAIATLVVEYQPTEQYRYHTLAALLAITRNRPAYEMLCRKMLTTFTNTSNPSVDERIAKDCSSCLIQAWT